MGMVQWDRFATAEARERIVRHHLSGEDLHRLPHALIRGWDYIVDLSEIDPPNGGVWRTPHFIPGPFFDDPEKAPVSMFEGIASLDDLYARVWRLIRVLPDEADEQSGDDDGEAEFCTSGKNTLEKDIFASGNAGRIAHRDHFLASIFGHPLRDHAEFLFDLRAKEPELGDLILQKRFGEASSFDPRLLDRPWPSSVQRRWRGENFDYLPPFAHAWLVAELQRLAQNVCSHAAVSYFSNGAEATLASTVRQCTRFQKKSNRAVPAHLIYDEAIADQIGMAPFQTLAVQCSPSALLNNDSGLAVRETVSAAAGLFNNMINYGRPLVDFVAGDHSRSPSPDLARGLTHHLDRVPERKAKKGSMAHRGDFTATYWGMNWLTHAYVGLWQLASLPSSTTSGFGQMAPGSAIVRTVRWDDGSASINPSREFPISGWKRRTRPHFCKRAKSKPSHVSRMP